MQFITIVTAAGDICELQLHNERSFSQVFYSVHDGGVLVTHIFYLLFLLFKTQKYIFFAKQKLRYLYFVFLCTHGTLFFRIDQKRINC